MIALIIRRIVTTLVVFVGVTLLIFGGTTTLPLSRRAGLITVGQLSDSVIARIYGYDQPLLIQYSDWLFGHTRMDAMTGEERIHGGVMRGDLGRSRLTGKPIAQVIRERLPRTLELVLLSLPLMATGMWFGMRAALSRGRFTRIARARFGLSLPAFILGWFIIMLVQHTNWFIVGEIPKEVTARYGLDQLMSYTGMLTVDSLLNGRPDVFVVALQHMVLPTLTLSLIGGALLFRVARSSALAVLQSSELIAMQGRGLPEKTIVKEYIRPKVGRALLAASGYLAFVLLDNVLIVEALFKYPGLGDAMAQAAVWLDLLTVLGILLLIATVALVVKLAVEIARIILTRRTQSWRSASSAA